MYGYKLMFHTLDRDKWAYCVSQCSRVHSGVKIGASDD